MLIKDQYAVREVLSWTRWELSGFLAYAALVVFLYEGHHLSFLRLPWTPIALIGTAVAFLVGFQSNSAYGRIWEARKIWGGIVNASRTWGMQIRDMVTNEHADKKLSEEELEDLRKGFVRRHVAWMTALRHSMRSPRSWETSMNHTTNKEWNSKIHIPERGVSLSEDLKAHLPEDEHGWVMSKKNQAAAILYLQSEKLRELKEIGYIWEFSFLKLQSLLTEFFTLQGKTERIKNFPYPRQYATISHQFVWIFIALLPFGIVPEFSKVATEIASSHPTVAPSFVWMAIPFSAAVSWVFHTLLRVGTSGENPFEGTSNDVPISAIARGIEIDLLQLYDFDDDTIPGPFPSCSNVQM